MVAHGARATCSVSTPSQPNRRRTDTLVSHWPFAQQSHSVACGYLGNATMAKAHHSALPSGLAVLPALISLRGAKLTPLGPWKPRPARASDRWRLAHDTPVTPVGLIRPAQYGLHCVLRRGSSFNWLRGAQSRLMPVQTWGCDLVAMHARCLSRCSGDNTASQDLQASTSFSPRLCIMLGASRCRGASARAP